MTIRYPDVSHYNAPLDLAGAPLVFAKATQGTGYVDPAYAGYRDQAQRLGISFGAYHWLDTGNAEVQAEHAYSVVGPDVPLMIDDEQPPVVPLHTAHFVWRYRELGGTVCLEYLPRWVWSASGRPDLSVLAGVGLSLVASDYNPSDIAYPGGTGWQPYGGLTPAILQYTSRQPFAGVLVDFNEFPGTLEELLDVITGGFMVNITQTDWDALRWRMDALLNNRPQVAGGPTKGERNLLHDALAALQLPAATAQLVDQELGKALSAAATAVTPPA